MDGAILYDLPCEAKEDALKELSEMTDREIDAAVAVDVMGWERQSESWYDGEGIEATRFISPEGIEETCYGWGDDCAYDELCIVPDFSTDIAVAFTVVEHFTKQGLSFVLDFYSDYGDDHRCGWSIAIDGVALAQFEESPAKAICLASLAAVRAGKGEVESR